MVAAQALFPSGLNPDSLQPLQSYTWPTIYYKNLKAKSHDGVLNFNYFFILEMKKIICCIIRLSVFFSFYLDKTISMIWFHWDTNCSISLIFTIYGLSMRLKYWFGFINISPMWSGMEERKGKRWDGLWNLYSLMDKLIIRSQLFSDFLLQ